MSVLTSPAPGIVGDEKTRAVVSEAVDGISQIATLPEITLKIIALVENPRSTAQDLHKLITNDPALVARILKVVNSAFYGLPGQIGSINRAIVLLGLNAVKNICIAASLSKLFRGGQIGEKYAAKDLWTHSIAVAVMSRLLVTKTNNTLPDEGFLAGLMHDIGVVVEWQSLPEQLSNVITAAVVSPMAYTAVETDLLGADHQTFGQALTAKWKFPRSLQYVTGFHHRPMTLAPEVRFLTSIVHVADHVCCQMNLGFSLTCNNDPLDSAVLQDLHITMPEVDQIAAGLPEAMREAEALLS